MLRLLRFLPRWNNVAQRVNRTEVILQLLMSHSLEIHKLLGLQLLVSLLQADQPPGKTFRI